jgi:hypothetical protein
MAKGYPVRTESTVLPECGACGSKRFREAHGGLRCEDCQALQRDPFKA